MPTRRAGSRLRPPAADDVVEHESRVGHRGDRAADEEQRVAGQERHRHQPGLDEDDREQDRADPRAVLGDAPLHVPVEVQEDVDELGEVRGGADVARHL
jgi:hypothetical protein